MPYQQLPRRLTENEGVLVAAGELRSSSRRLVRVLQRTYRSKYSP